MVLLYGPRKKLFLMSEVPLYTWTSPWSGHCDCLLVNLWTLQGYFADEKLLPARTIR
jgi:hypothetical protein